MPTGPPKCALCKTTDSTKLESEDLQKVWQSELGSKWNWHTDDSAYWKFCLRCHQRYFPDDHRVGNRHSKPRCAVVWKRWCGPFGDFYLTSPPPEILRPPPPPCFADQPTNNARSRTPRGERGAAASATRARELHSLFTALFGTAELPLPAQRSCLAGSRGFKLECRTQLGPDDYKRRSYYPACKPLTRENKDRSLWEEFITYEAEQEAPPPYDWPAVCEVQGCDERLPEGLERLDYARIIVPSSDPAGIHQCFFCTLCHPRLLAGAALLLCSNALGPRVQAWTPWKGHPLWPGRTRAEYLHECGARFTPKKLGGKIVLRPDESKPELIHRWEELCKQHNATTEKKKDALRPQFAQQLEVERQHRDTAAQQQALVTIPAVGHKANAEGTPPEQLASAPLTPVMQPPAACTWDDDAPLLFMIPGFGGKGDATPPEQLGRAPQTPLAHPPASCDGAGGGNDDSSSSSTSSISSSSSSSRSSRSSSATRKRRRCESSVLLGKGAANRTCKPGLRATLSPPSPAF